MPEYRQLGADERSAAYALAVMATVYALLLARLGIKRPLIYPLDKVFPH